MLLAFHTDVQDSSAAPGEPGGPGTELPATLHFLGSAYGTLGRYSTDTRSRTASAYVTLSEAWQDYYTAGYSRLWLERDDAGGRYYTQHLAVARASVFLPPRITLALHYAYLDEGEIQRFSQRTVFHWMGGAASYWFSPFLVAGTSSTLSLSGGTIASGIVRAFCSFEVAAGIWSTTTAVVSDVTWTPPLFSVHQTISVPLGANHRAVVSAGLGRRAFYFDDETLVMYNQRVVQTGFVQVRVTVNVVGGFSFIPAFEYNAHGEYSALYGSVGVRAVF